MGNRYIQNVHNAPITANARNKKGAVLFTKKFLPERIDGTTGRVISTGYTILTEEEYSLLIESSRIFAHYKDDLGLLVECDDLPPEAKTPQEALADARRKERAAQDRVGVLEAENAALKKENGELKAALYKDAAESDALKKDAVEKAARGGKGKEFN
jgi:hypothetical protein